MDLKLFRNQRLKRLITFCLMILNARPPERGSLVADGAGTKLARADLAVAAGPGLLTRSNGAVFPKVNAAGARAKFRGV